jgi:hypothetical protein
MDTDEKPIKEKEKISIIEEEKYKASGLTQNPVGETQK